MLRSVHGVQNDLDTRAHGRVARPSSSIVWIGDRKRGKGTPNPKLTKAVGLYPSRSQHWELNAALVSGITSASALVQYASANYDILINLVKVMRNRNNFTSSFHFKF